MTTYKENPIPLRWFRISEFDDKTAPGSGVNMRVDTLMLLDAARGRAGVPFVINSGYRTPERNKAVGGVKDSAHLGGWAADIRCRDESEQKIICAALYACGFRRFGLARTFVHVDNDPAKRPALWYYGNYRPAWKPSKL